MINLFGNKNSKSSTPVNNNAPLVITKTKKSIEELDLSDIPDIYSVGGDLNLVRAVYDGSEEVMKRIDNTISLLDKRKEQLLKLKAAHEQMLKPAKEYISFINNGKSR